MSGVTTPREIFLVGSISLPDASAVFSDIGRRLGDAVRRIPDGETGERLGWLEWLLPYLEAHPALETVPSQGDWRNATAPDKWKHKTWFRLASGAEAGRPAFRDIGYARNAKQSFAAFRDAKARGDVPDHCQMLIAIPSPFNVVNQHFAPDERGRIEPAWEAGVLDEVAEIAAALPPGEVAIQWDCAHDMQAYDDARDAWFEPRHEGIVERLARIGDAVPADIEMGYHLCYGSFGGKHFVEPRDAGAMVRLSNAVSAAVRRRIDWIHMPVPVERDDDAYFRPLADLALEPETRVHLGLIHDSDGEAGTEARIAAASKYLDGFGLATECGFGRRPPETVADLLALHARLARKA